MGKEAWYFKITDNGWSAKQSPFNFRQIGAQRMALLCDELESDWADEGGDEVLQIIALLANEFEITRRELSKQCL